MKKKIQIVLLSIFLGLSSFPLGEFFANELVDNEEKVVEVRQEEEALPEDIVDSDKEKEGAEYTPDSGIVKDLEITSMMTGTAPFDDVSGPGKDASAYDNEVRTFDMVSFTVDINMAVNRGESGSEEANESVSFKGGEVMVKATIPQELDGQVEWDLASMLWLKDPKLSSDKRTVTGSYELSKQEITIPGNQTLVFTAKVLSAVDKTKFNADFDIWMLGNDETEAKSVSSEMITIRSNPSLNLLIRNGNPLANIERELPLGENGENINVLLYGFGVAIQNYTHDNKSKGIRGLEMPRGEIKYKLDLKTVRSKGGEVIDVTDKVTPRLYNYKYNSSSNNGVIPGRTMDFGRNTTRNLSIPTGKAGPKATSVRDSGNIEVVDLGNGEMEVTVKDYKYFDDYSFPRKNDGASELSGNAYGLHEMAFISKIIDVYLPIDEIMSVEQATNYTLTADVELISADMGDGRIISEEEKLNDNRASSRIDYYPKGSFSKNNWYHYRRGNGTSSLHSHWALGDAFRAKGQDVWIHTEFGSNVTNSESRQPRTINMLSKFDDEAFEPEADVDGQRFFTTQSSNLGPDRRTWTMLYGAKPDGTGWNSDEELAATREDELVFYSSVEELKADGKIPVAVLFESSNDYVMYPGGIETVRYRVKMKDTAEIGKVYATVNSVRAWTQSLDRSKYTMLNGAEAFDDAPETTVSLRMSEKYVKQAYDDRGSMIPGTHTGYPYGNSILIVGTQVEIAKSIPRKSTSGGTKISYDIGAGEGIIPWELEARFKSPSGNNNSPATHHIRVEDILPFGLTYVPGTAFVGGSYDNNTNKVVGGSLQEPEITIVKDKEGRDVQSLTWDLGDRADHLEVPKIIFETEIDPELRNQTQLLNTAYVHTPSDLSSLDKRKAEASAFVINLTAHNIYKKVDKKVMDLNEKFTYTLSYRNASLYLADYGKILDILPYNGDGRGSNFSGDYTVDDLKIDLGGNKLGKIYVTSDPAARDLQAKTANPNHEMWKEVKPNSEGVFEINDKITAFLYEGSYEAEKGIDFIYTITPKGNKANDIYANDATMNIEERENDIVMVPVLNRVVKRDISGKVWYDFNKDGIQGMDEKRVKNFKVKLYNKDGTIAKDVYGKEVDEIITPENGEYKFENLSEGQYEVRFYTDKDYDLTIKDAKDSNKANNSDAIERNGYFVIEDIELPKTSDIHAGYHVERNLDVGVYAFKDVKLVKKFEEFSNDPIDMKFKLFKDGKMIEEYEKTSDSKGFEMVVEDVVRIDETGHEPIYDFVESYISLPWFSLGIDKEGDTTTITNTYLNPTVSIKVDKTWVFGPDKRPDIKIQLYADGKPYGDIECIRSGEKSFVYEDLPMINKNNEEIEYTVEEIDVPENYKSSVKGFEIINEYIIPKTEVIATKVWINGPEKKEDIQIQLYRSGEEYGDPITLKDGETQYKWTDLDKTDKYGNEYLYEVNELTELKGYETVTLNDGLTIVNTYVPETVDLTVTKVWDGGKDSDKVAVFSLLKDGYMASDRITLTKDNPSFTFENLPKEDEFGNEIKYTVQEESLDKNFEPSVDYSKDDEIIITNKYVSPKMDLFVEKKWNGGVERFDVEFQLYQNDKKHRDPVIIKEGENGYMFKDLDVTDKNGENYEYRVEEVTKHAHYKPIVSKNGLVITNEYVSPKTKLVINKEWNGGTYNKPVVEFEVYQNDELYEVVSLPSDKDSLTLEVDEYDKNGVTYKYDVIEKELENYDSSKTRIDNTFNFLNTYVVPKGRIKLNKVWKGYILDEMIKPVEVIILQDEKEFGSKFTLSDENNWMKEVEVPMTDKEGKPFSYDVKELTDLGKFFEVSSKVEQVQNVFNIELENYNILKGIDIKVTKVYDGDNYVGSDVAKIELVRNDGFVSGLAELSVDNTEHTFENVPAFDDKGNKYTYSIREVDVPEYFSVNIERIAFDEFVVTNTFDKLKTEHTVVKKWVNGPSEKPGIKVQLLKNNEPFKEPVLLKEGNTSHTWLDLDKYDENGKLNIYSAKEVEVPNKYGEVTVTEGIKTTITNTFIPGLKDLEFNKEWIGGNIKKHDIKYQLYRDGKKYLDEIDMSNNSNVIKNVEFEDKNGKEYKFTIKEVNTPELYEFDVDIKTSKDKIVFNGVNKYVSDNIDVEAEKVWVNGPKIKPDVEFELFRNGESTGIKKTIKHPATKVVFKDMTRTDEYANEYHYEVKEHHVPENYIMENTSDLVITNTYISPKIEVKVEKSWVDGPESKPNAEFALFRDGENMNKNVVLTNGQSEHIWVDLDETDINGNPYEYSVKEVNVPENYRVEMVKDGNTFRFTNTYVSPKIDIKVNKEWILDSLDETDILVALIRDGKALGETVKISTGDYSFTFKGLDKTDKSGKDYNYEIKELSTPDGMVDKVEGFTITNTELPRISKTLSEGSMFEVYNVGEEYKYYLTISMPKGQDIYEKMNILDTLDDRLELVDSKVVSHEIEYNNLSKENSVNIELEKESIKKISDLGESLVIEITSIITEKGLGDEIENKAVLETLLFNDETHEVESNIPIVSSKIPTHFDIKLNKDVEGKDSIKIKNNKEYTYNLNVELPDDLLGVEELVLVDQLDERLTFISVSSEDVKFSYDEESGLVNIRIARDELDKLNSNSFSIQLNSLINEGVEDKDIPNTFDLFVKTKEGMTDKITSNEVYVSPSIKLIPDKDPALVKKVEGVDHHETVSTEKEFEYTLDVSIPNTKANHSSMVITDVIDDRLSILDVAVEIDGKSVDFSINEEKLDKNVVEVSIAEDIVNENKGKDIRVIIKSHINKGHDSEIIPNSFSVSINGKVLRSNDVTVSTGDVQSGSVDKPQITEPTPTGVKESRVMSIVAAMITITSAITMSFIDKKKRELKA